MKNSSSLLFHRLALSLFCALGLAALAQQPPASAEKPTPAQQPAAAEATPPATTPPAVDTPKSEEAPLRRIDEPIQEPKQRGRRNRRSVDTDPPFGDHVIAEGNRADRAISIMGSTAVDGEVDADAVSVMGNTTVGPKGKVGRSAVAVLGHMEVRGEVGQKTVTVLGSAYIDGHVGQELVCVLGDIELGPNAVVDGKIVNVGGTLKKDPKAVVNGNEVNVPFSFGQRDFAWLVSYIKNCVMLARPLAFAPHLGWAWLIAFCFFGFYLLLAALFSGPLTKCVQTLETRPGSSVLAAVLTVLLTPVAIVLLCFTVIGVVLVPFVALGLFFAALFGKATMLAWIGRRFTKFFGDGILGHIFFAVLIGGLIVLLLYTVPVMGFLLLKLLGWLGLGVVIYTILLGMKKPKPAMAAVGGGGGAVAAAAMSASMPVAEPVTSVAPDVSAPMGIVSEPAAAATEPVPPAVGAVPVAAMPPPVARQPVVLASTLPRAGFFIRLGALLLDIILLSALIAFFTSMIPRGLLFHMNPPGMLPVLAIYGAVMWKLKGTTIGGIVCGLKVVRIDNRELDWATAVVRALGCFLSFIVVGLGFIWVAIDDEKQSWHDKIAGTTVVHVPKGTSLL
jgi:uncharacterized RDD family membrane protein YckC